MFDEIYLDSSLQYNRKEDCVDGLEDYGHKKHAVIADHANVFMIRGVYRQWKQAICFSFSSGPAKSVDLKNMISNVIISCQDIRLKVTDNLTLYRWATLHLLSFQNTLATQATRSRN